MATTTTFDELKAKRRTIKASITRNQKAVLAFKAGDSVLSIKARLPIIHSLYGEYTQVQEKIEIFPMTFADGEEEAWEAENEADRCRVDTQYFDIVGNIEKILADSSSSILSSGSTAAVNVVKQPPATEFEERSMLKPLPLPSFSGEYSDWSAFIDTFKSLVHNDQTLSNVKKFHYLRSCLHDEALIAISHFAVTNDNYNGALQVLHDEFENKRIIIHDYVNNIINISPLNKPTPTDLRQFINTVNANLIALKALDVKTDTWDAMLVPLLTSKLDYYNKKDWQLSLKKELPTTAEFMNFLSQRCGNLKTLAKLNVDAKITSPGSNSSKPKVEVRQNPRFVNAFVNTHFKCEHCKGDHPLYKCGSFLRLSVAERCEQVKKLNLCLNCFRRGHHSRDCKSGTCRHCSKQHNTLLHLSSPDSGDISEQVSLHSFSTTTQALLSTAIIKIKDSKGRYHRVRALLDGGSQSSFITAELHKRLGLSKRHVSIRVAGFGQTPSTISGRCETVITSSNGNFMSPINCLITSRITGVLPSTQFSIEHLKIPKSISLADTNFNHPSEVDVLLGADVFWQLLCVGQIKLNVTGLVLQKTRLGWIIGGPFAVPEKTVNCHLVRSSAIEDQLQKFWEVETIGSKRMLSQEEKSCEENFIDKTTRNDDGRFVVSIPFKGDFSLLGDSKVTAEKRFSQLERKLSRNEVLHREYTKFMSEYERLGHMRQVACDNAKISYYLPHHGVIREESTTTKLRVVFDASAKTSSGLSLNDLQMVGPTIQDDLFSILLRFRKHAVVFCADVEKMYRQVLVAPKFHPLQRILWRSSPTEPIGTYELQTVTYGTAAASFLAIRSLYQLGIEHESSSPCAAKAIKQDFYVDDLISGCDSINEAIKICRDVSRILSKACFNLRKWSSNHQQVIDAVSADSSEAVLNLGEHQNTKTLGLHWHSRADHLFFCIKDSEATNVTKRVILSESSQIFDPLGLLAPTTIIAKMLLQAVWLQKIGWDESMPIAIHTKWMMYRQQLSSLNALRIERHAFSINSFNIQLHGFSDASENAYGAAIYVRTLSSDGTVTVRLLTAKSKVAPLKAISIPRLELCGAVVLVQLMQKVSDALHLHNVSTFYWTDSMIVLGWLQIQPRNLQVFVGNRVALIQESGVDNWRHVPSHSNPADLLSRGVYPGDLQASRLWWGGPEWLKSGESAWPIPPIIDAVTTEVRENSDVRIHIATAIDNILQRFSSFNRARRVIAYCLRFTCSGRRPNIELNSDELNRAELRIIKLVQQEQFTSELAMLEAKDVQKMSKSLSSLSPFLDSDGVMRVGGRLANSHFDPVKMHPAILPARHHVTKLIFVAEHRRLLHAGPQMLLSSIRDKFWPIGGRNLARQTVRTCIKCFRAQPIPSSALMGDLPEQRVTPSFPFETTGVDYAGPIMLKDRPGRGYKLVKMYIALFVCFGTKAVHLELVTSLTTEAFLAAFTRFSCRRGKPREVFSDNGRNFVGANNELRELKDFISAEAKTIDEKAANDGIRWHFIPPDSPHFGGLWEAGVKSTKHHLKRVASNVLMTYEQMHTLLLEVESVLNSRPLCPLSSDPNDLTALTPSHFLIGRKLTSLPAHDYSSIPVFKLSIFQHISLLKQHFWTRWSSEYISELQQRNKWRSTSRSLKLGDLVIVKESNIPVSAWRLGRVIEIHPGKDGVNRVVTVRTSVGVMKKSVVKLCLMPLDVSA